MKQTNGSLQQTLALRQLALFAIARIFPYIQGTISNVVGAGQSSIQSLIVTLDASRTVFEILTFKLENGLFPHLPVFDAPARYAAAHYDIAKRPAVCPSVRPSVRLSHFGIMSKRQNISSKVFTALYRQYSGFLERNKQLTKYRQDHLEVSLK